MKILAGARLALAISVALGAPALADSQPVPCISCAIAAQQSAISAQVNQQIIRSSVQNAVTNQLQTQSLSQQQQTQQMRAQLQNQMLTNANSMQTILLEQQLLLLQLQMNAAPQPHKAPAKPKHVKPITPH